MGCAAKLSLILKKNVIRITMSCSTAPAASVTKLGGLVVVGESFGREE